MKDVRHGVKACLSALLAVFMFYVVIASRHATGQRGNSRQFRRD